MTIKLKSFAATGVALSIVAANCVPLVSVFGEAVAAKHSEPTSSVDSTPNGRCFFKDPACVMGRLFN